MSYAVKREKVFARADPAHPNCTPPVTKRSDHRLKRFQSTFDRRAWHCCDKIRYNHFYDLMSGSQTCIDVDQCHKYVPLEDLINILMAEKDALIKHLQERAKGSDDQETKDDNEINRNKFSQQNQILELTEEVNKSRDMLRQAMHKLENIDEIVNENKKLQCRLRCSEEKVKYLEEKKKRLENELADLRSKSQIQIDLEKAQQMLSKVTQQRDEFKGSDETALQNLALERDELQEKVKKLEKELEDSKKKEQEIEILKKQSQSDSFDKEEITRENECYRKKLASMKCLEKQIQELKKQGRALADKYKRETQKAAHQMNKMCQATKELQGLREERDSLRKRVNELSSYECQYNKLQRKLRLVDAVIAENENLNSKLLALQKLEKENEYLKCRLETIREMEMNAAGDKERIVQLQCAVADQEEEMKDLLCQIERLTNGRHEEELERLKCELYEKNSKLKLCEEQLAEIPMLEAEIDELRMKLQCCCRDFSKKKTGENSYQKIEVKFPAPSTGVQLNYRNPKKKCSSTTGMRHEIKVDFKDQSGSCREIPPEERGRAHLEESDKQKDEMSCEEVQNLLHSSKGIISCVLEDMIEHQKEMEKLEICNRTMKEEIESLKKNVVSSGKDNLLQELDKLKKILEKKELEICRLRQQAESLQEGEDVQTLKELNHQMKMELEKACAALKQVANLEKMLEMERKARCEAESKLRGQELSRSDRPVPSGFSKSTAQLSSSESPDSDYCQALQKEVDDLKLQAEALKNLTEELQKENKLLRELQQPCPDFSKELDEKCALENLLSLLQAELDAFKGQKLSDECEALRKELKRVMEQNCQLKALVDCYRQRLDLEKKSNELRSSSDEMVESPGGTGRGQKSSCEEELKALRDKFSKMQQENQNLKKHIQDSGLEAPAWLKEVADEAPEEDKKQLKKEDKQVKKLGELTPDEQMLEKKRDQIGEAERTEKLEGAELGSGSPERKEFGTSGPASEEPGKLGLRSEERKTGGPGSKEPGTKEPKSEGPESKGPGTKEPGSEESGTKEPKSEGPEKGEPEKGEPEKGKPEKGKPEKKELEKGEPEKGKPEKGEPEKKESEKGEPEKGKPEKGEPEKKESEKGEPEKGKPEKREPEKGEPEKREPEKGEPEKGKPEKKEPEKGEPEKGKPEKGEPEKKEPEKGESEKGKPEKKEPEKGEPEKGKPEKGGPEKKEPEKGEPEKGKPEKKEPEKGEPEKGKLEKGGPEKGEPEKKGPEKGKPEKGKPEKGGPEKGEPESKGPKSEGPGSEGLESRDLADTVLPTDVAELQALVRQLEAECAEKLRKMVDQHEKELSDREKTYNDNLNAMKSGYETDIRKLADRHKQSIMRLQELHEDEVQELNLNYETQLDMMQTQSEAAVKDVAKGSAAKMRKLNDQHLEDLKNLEQQFHDALDEKETKYLEELGGLRSSLTKSMQELKALKQKENAAGDPDKLKAQHAREMQKLKRTSMQKMNAMKEKLEEERKKSEMEIEALKKKLKDQESGDGVCTCSLSRKKSPKLKDPSYPLDFNEVLEKILEEGLDSLTFNEIALVHRKTCCALEGVVMKSNASPLIELEPPVGDACPHTPLLEADKQQLLSRIFTLENEILQKQKLTQEAIISMEVSIKKERCRLQEVRNLLENEQQKNSKLKLLLNSQTKLQADIKRERDHLENQASLHQILCDEKTKQLDEEVKSKKCLEAEVKLLKSKLKQLGSALDSERGKLNSKQEDQLEQMRIKLEQTVLEERRLALQLGNEIKHRTQLQCQLQTLRQSFKHMVNLPEVENDIKITQNLPDSKSAKEKQNLDQIKEKKNKIKTKPKKNKK